MLKSICIAYDVSLNWLINGEKPIFKDGRNDYGAYQEKTNVPAQGNLLALVLEEIEHLLPNIDRKLKAYMIAFYCDYYTNLLETNYETIKKEIADSYKFMAYLLGGKKMKYVLGYFNMLKEVVTSLSYSGA